MKKIGGIVVALLPPSANVDGTPPEQSAMSVLPSLATLKLTGWETQTIPGILALYDLEEETTGEASEGGILARCQSYDMTNPGDINIQSTIRMLQTKLKVQPQKVLNHINDERRTRRYERDSLANAFALQVFLEKPFGEHYYQAITCPFLLLNNTSVMNTWKEHPIDQVTVTLIPQNVTANDIRSDRMVRCEKVTLHFLNDQPFSTVMTLLKGMQLVDTKVIEIRGVKAIPAQCRAAMIQLKPFFHKLESINVGTVQQAK